MAPPALLPMPPLVLEAVEAAVTTMLLLLLLLLLLMPLRTGGGFQ